MRLFEAASFVFTPFYQSDSRVLPFLRATLVATVARVPPGPRLLASLVSGLTIPPLGGLMLPEPDWTAPRQPEPGPAHLPLASNGGGR